MYSIEYLKSLPRVEVSFQDDFAGDIREVTLTPRYILHKLDKSGFKSTVGSRILLWEKDRDQNNKEYYLCNVGEITPIPKAVIDDYKIVSGSTFIISNEPVMIKSEKETNFELPINSIIFI